ncbi:RIFT barrel domain-containing protein [Thermodesulfatator autotrophicus]|uniref:Uncharacterized protein n=1 Tax=Thermodesulfatator autotrophicus TaxID=1795632 RepID=A0A177E6Z1_9BACT|nr:hypothetical protein [Thermodesulfatator autotrophicus]OAG26992.1 hypothetical protein TH606_09190 [Thermodesulfatator autotrophicus]
MPEKLTYITLKEKAGKKRLKEPASFGLPLPEGLVKDAKTLAILNPEGNQVLAQWKPLLYWPDGSLKWVLGDFLADVEAGEEKKYAVALKKETSFPETSLSLTKTESFIEVKSSHISFLISKKSSFLENVLINEQAILAKTNWQLKGAKEKQADFEVKNIEVEEAGPLKVVIGIRGQISPKQDLHLLFYQRLSFWHNLPLVKVEFTIRNPRRAKHKGGYWDLGDPGSMYIKDLSLILCPAEENEKIFFSLEGSWSFKECFPPFEVYQDSSGGELWQSPVHVNREGIVPVTFKGFRLKQESFEKYGLRANPLVKAILKNNYEITLAVPYFWQNFPKAIKIEKSLIRFALFPEEFNDLHEIQGGEQKTHEFWLAFGDKKQPVPDISWVFSPLVPVLDPEWISQTKAVLYFSIFKEDPDYAKITQEALEGENSFFVKREKIDEYGWRNFGDVYADHETVFHKGERPLVSHYNNQYDLIYSFLFQFLRTGDRRWFTLGEEP